MIEWSSVLFNSLWIIGLSLSLSALGLGYYAASVDGCRFALVMARPAYQLAIHTGAILFCLGLLGSTSSIWERVAWIVLTALFVLKAVGDRKKKRTGTFER
jgi:hypothetical protein